jgi:hypothetical protein
MELIVLVAVVAIVVIGALWWRSRRAADGGASRQLEALDTLSSWEPTPTRILTAQERLAYQVLVRALPDHMVLAQVPLSRFLKVPTRNSYSEWLSRVGQLCADLVVCDHSSTVIAVIDVRVPPHQASDRNRKRHDRMRRVLKAAGIPLHIWFENALPTPDAAREAVLPKSEAVPGAPAQPATARPAVQPRAVPTLDEETGVLPDEVIEMGEPPPSTWFDNLESRPAPLRQVPNPAPAQAPKQPAKPR